jgi:phosphate transport system protein
MAMHLHRDLDKLSRDLVALASLVEAGLRNATRALCQRDARLARQVIAGDLQIDAEEIQIDEECLKILALHQPVAIDLRRIAAAMMVNTDLERIGDLSEEIAERALHLCTQPALPIPSKLLQMAELTTTMVSQCLDGFVQRNTTLAGRVLRLDDEVDGYNDEIIADLIETMKSSPHLVPAGLSLFSATRHLEQIADHATNIAEEVVYLVEGEVVRHRQSEVRSQRLDTRN